MPRLARGVYEDRRVRKVRGMGHRGQEVLQEQRERRGVPRLYAAYFVDPPVLCGKNEFLFQ